MPQRREEDDRLEQQLKDQIDKRRKEDRPGLGLRSTA